MLVAVMPQSGASPTPAAIVARKTDERAADALGILFADGVGDGVARGRRRSLWQPYDFAEVFFDLAQVP